MPDKLKHTPGLLEVCYTSTGVEIITKGGAVRIVPPIVGTFQREADFERMVACWNALEGRPDPSAVGKLLEAAALVCAEAASPQHGKGSTNRMLRLREAVGAAMGETDGCEIRTEPLSSIPSSIEPQRGGENAKAKGE